MPVEEYLYYLSRLSSKYHYQSVSLNYQPDFLVITGFEQLPEVSSYEMSILVKQYFSGFSGNPGFSYSDLTFKSFMWVIREVEEKTYSAKLKSIRVRETIEVSWEELAQVRKDFKKYKEDFYSLRGRDKR